MADKPKREKKPRSSAVKKGLIRLTILVAGVVLMLGLALLLSVLIAPGEEEPEPVSLGDIQPDSRPVPTPEPDSNPESEPEKEPDPDPVQKDIDWSQIGPAQQDISAMELAEPQLKDIVLPANGRVDMAYFNTVTFVGDSLTQGLEIYSTGIPNASYCAYKGISPKSIYDGSIQTRTDGTREVPMDALVESAPDYVYVLLGANAMVSMTDDAIIEYYRTMLDEIKENLHPDVYIYVQSITAVREDNDPGFEMERILGLNERLAYLAYEEDVFYLDLNEVLMSEDGDLREELAATDGYHLNADGYTTWKEYLITHTAYHTRIPYTEGPITANPAVLENYPETGEAPVSGSAEEGPEDGEGEELPQG